MPTSPIPAPGDRAVSTVSPLDDPHWDTALSALPGATFFHGSAWARVLRDTYGFTPFYLTQRKGVPLGRSPALKGGAACPQDADVTEPISNRVGDNAVHPSSLHSRKELSRTESLPLHSALPLMEANSWLKGRRGIALPLTDECAPLCQDASAFKSLTSTVSAHAERRNWKYWEIRGGRPFLPDAPASLSFRGHSLALKPDPTALFSRLESSTRRAVRKAEQNDLNIEFSTSPEAVQTFYQLLALTRRRHGLPPQPFAFFDHIQRHILAQDQGIIVLAHFHHVPVAGAVFFQFGATALYKFGASDESFQHLRANNLVMWRALEWYSKKGYASLDFGRTSLANDGLRRFKLSWGATERLVEYFRFDRTAARFVTDRDESSGWHNRLFRLMPLSLSRLIGALAYKHMA